MHTKQQIDSATQWFLGNGKWINSFLLYQIDSGKQFLESLQLYVISGRRYEGQEQVMSSHRYYGI